MQKEKLMFVWRRHEVTIWIVSLTQFGLCISMCRLVAYKEDAEKEREWLRYWRRFTHRNRLPKGARCAIQWFIYLFSASSTRKLIVYKLLAKTEDATTIGFIMDIYHFIYHSPAWTINFISFEFFFSLLFLFRLLTWYDFFFFTVQFCHIYNVSLRPNRIWNILLWSPR